MAPQHRFIHVSTLVATIFVVAWAVVGLGGSAMTGISSSIAARLNSPPADSSGAVATASRSESTPGASTPSSPPITSPSPPDGASAASGGAPVAPTQPTTPGRAPTAAPTGSSPAPVVDVGPNSNLEVGGVYAGSGSVVDPAPGVLTGTVNYGDGTGDTPFAMTGHTFRLSHIFKAIGTYTVIVQVTDSHGGVGTGYTVVTVGPALGGAP